MGIKRPVMGVDDLRTLNPVVAGWISFLNATLWLPKKQLYCAIDLFAEALLMLRILRFRATRGQCH